MNYRNKILHFFKFLTHSSNAQILFFIQRSGIAPGCTWGIWNSFIQGQGTNHLPLALKHPLYCIMAPV